MYFSKHNIISQVKNSDNFFIVNLLSGNADIISAEEAAEIRKEKYSDPEALISKGYLVDEEEEEKTYRNRYLEFIENRESDEIQLFFVTNYTCNFKCSYCYQDEYSYSSAILTKEIIDAFFTYIKNRFITRQKYITLFGGEPLLPGNAQKENLSYFFEKASENNLDVAIVTNGFHLSEYMPLFKKAKIREIQVTLDGTSKIHDIRRSLKNGGKTFDRIVEGIDAALENEYPVNLRMVIDEDNISDLPHLATFAIEKGWTDKKDFKTQLGRNYELHHCNANSKKLFSRISMYDSIYKLIIDNPHILKFHKPAFSVSRFLSEKGKLPSPLFDSCPGTKTEWAFDYNGKIYSCTATVGKTREELGTFFPEIKLEEEKISKWEERDVLSIELCKTCQVQLACGGGCGAVAKNNKNSICQPDCRPVKELLEFGISLYF